jgi:hypothetical protein
MNLYSISRCEGTSKVICQGVMRNIDTSMGTQRPIDYPCPHQGFRRASGLLVNMSRFLRVPTRIALYVTQFKAFHSSKERPLLFACKNNYVHL